MEGLARWRRGPCGPGWPRAAPQDPGDFFGAAFANPLPESIVSPGGAAHVPMAASMYQHYDPIASFAEHDLGPTLHGTCLD